MFSKRPNITPAQVIAGVPVVAALLAAFGVYSPTPDQQDAVAGAIQWSFVLLGADAVIRIGRNAKDAKVEAAALANGGPVDPGEPTETEPPPVVSK